MVKYKSKKHLDSLLLIDHYRHALVVYVVSVHRMSNVNIINSIHWKVTNLLAF